MEEDRELTTKELIKRLKISQTTLWSWRKKGLPFKKYGTHIYRYDWEEVEKWLLKETKPRLLDSK